MSDKVIVKATFWYSIVEVFGLGGAVKAASGSTVVETGAMYLGAEKRRRPELRTKMPSSIRDPKTPRG